MKKNIIKKVQRLTETASSTVVEGINWKVQDVSRRLETMNDIFCQQTLKLNLIIQLTLCDRWLGEPNMLFDRSEFGFWLNFQGLFGEGVEVGVYKGDYSRLLLDTWRGRVLHSVDPWMSFEKTEYQDVCNLNDDEHEVNFQKTCKKLEVFGARSQIVRTTSREASLQFKDFSLDFVYIDAQHHFDAVVEDINLWYPKIRSGGIICGHDYLDGTIASGEYGVKSAVDQFGEKNGLELIVTRVDPYPSWFAKKV